MVTPAARERIEPNVVCPGCGCACDDLQLRFAGDTLVSVAPECPLAEEWFMDNARRKPPVASLDGSPAKLNAAIARAAEILAAAKYPLVFGLARSGAPGQRAAVELAERLGGVIDTPASLTHAGATLAMQEFGEVGCTLGEVRNRADLVIFWGCDPAASHPRHAERYSVHPRGRYRANGRADRRIVMIGPREKVEGWTLDAAATAPDHIIALEPGGEFAAVAQLRQALRAGNVNALPKELAELLKQMRDCQTGVVFYGVGLGNDSCEATSPAVVGGLLQLVAELNVHGRFYARRLPRQGAAPGGENVLTWQTGYPFAVDFSRGFPRHNGLEFSAERLLARGEVDACLLVGSDAVALLSAAARERLQSLPTIALDPPAVSSPTSAQVSITTAAYGLHASGLIFRMDNVPLQTRKLVESEYPTDESVLRSLIAATCGGPEA